MHEIRVDDPSDPRVSELADLTDAEARRRVETERGCFVAESPLVVRAVVETGHRLRRVLVADNRVEQVREILGDVDVEVLVAPMPVLEAVTGVRLHRGVIATVDRPPPHHVADVLDRHHLVVVDAGNDHENLGAVFRTAAAFDAGVVLGPTAADPLYRRCVRVSMGHVLRVPWVRLDLPAGLGRIGDAGFRTVALTPGAATTVDEVVADGTRVAWVVGAEGPGLGADLLAAADVCAGIPIRADVDSLNVAAAAAIALSRSSPVR